MGTSTSCRKTLLVPIWYFAKSHGKMFETAYFPPIISGVRKAKTLGCGALNTCLLYRFHNVGSEPFAALFFSLEHGEELGLTCGDFVEFR